ncbi:hypothetical protein Leryth_002391 [Lithospermum erythrorhizon]|nr:hypothetical protein Leryth_002391 [Lithospermum erythrorhizon]
MRSISQTPSIITSFLLLLLLLAPASNAAITCSNVISNLSSCLSYLQSGGTPSNACCGGAKALAASAKTTEDKQTACSCMKNAASRFKVNPESANALPKSCGIQLPFDISPNVDCSKIS